MDLSWLIDELIDWLSDQFADMVDLNLTTVYSFDACAKEALVSAKPVINIATVTSNEWRLSLG